MRHFFLLNIAVLFLVFSVRAQINTSSPYSMYGIGKIEPIALGQSQGIAGTGIALRPFYGINPINPASYSSIPLQSFIFQAGMRSERTNFKTETESYTSFDNSFNSVSFAFKANRYWASSFGLAPLSSVGYKISETKDLVFNNETTKTNTQFSGSGGISKIYWGNAFSYKKISAGINASYLFGTISRQSTVVLTDTNYLSLIADERKYKIKDFIFDFGAQYRDTLSKKYTYCIGVTYAANQNINSTFSRFSSAVYQFSGGVNFMDTIMNDTLSTDPLRLPQSIGFGLCVQSDQWIFAADYTKTFWENAKILNSSSQSFTNYNAFSCGVEYTPRSVSKNFFQAMNYRLGGRYGKGYLQFGDVVMSDMAATLGFGFPIRKSSSRIDLSFEVGKRGTTKNGLIEEDYYQIHLNFNMGDLWFVKRKFD